MISFELSEEQKIAQSAVAEFAAKVLRPIARTVDSAKSIDASTLNQLWGLGVVQALIDQAQSNGSPQSAILGALVMEELGWADAAFAVALSGPLGFIRAVAEQGSAAQKEELLPLFAGDTYRGAAVCLAEPGLMSGVRATETKVEAYRGGYRLTGAKIQIPLADGCGHFLVIAQNDGKQDAFIVPASTPGVTISPPEGNLGLLGLRLATARFDDVVVSAQMRLGGSRGCDVQRIIDTARVGASSILIGVCRGVYDHSAAYTKERVAHGSALARKQSVAFRLVDMFIEIEAGRWMCWRAATHLDKRSTATRSASLAHIYVREQAAWITDEGVQLMGGHGFMRANPVELWYRNARTLAMLEGVGSV